MMDLSKVTAAQAIAILQFGAVAALMTYTRFLEIQEMGPFGLMLYVSEEEREIFDAWIEIVHADLFAQQKKEREDREKREKERRENPCKKCCGHGFITAYQHISDGICFACKGSGINP